RVDHGHVLQTRPPRSNPLMLLIGGRTRTSGEDPIWMSGAPKQLEKINKLPVQISSVLPIADIRDLSAQFRHSAEQGRVNKVGDDQAEKGVGQWHVQIHKKRFPPQRGTFRAEIEAKEQATTTVADMIRGVHLDRTERSVRL
ncbi:hypothetical protein, partial [Mesorhizobium sp. KR2-14]|uniref:hypothetical protein n=1 Tax=Mesorhizobium sp. KR2-14 TaxID=3156610 RepID=UPI0032B5500A